MSLDNKLKDEEYNSRFTKEDIVYLKMANCTPKEADAYNSQFSGEDIFWLFREGCSPNKAEEYNPKLSGFYISHFLKENCPQSKISKYNSRFDASDIYCLFQAGCSPEEADKYNPRLGGRVISYLFKRGCSPEMVDKYGLRFGEWDIYTLFQAGCSPEEADKYSNRFHGCDIIWLLRAGCSPEDADKYDAELSGYSISILYSMGIKPNINSVINQKKFTQIFSNLFPFSVSSIHTLKINKVIDEAKKFKILGTGISGVVLLKRNNAWKFSENISIEHFLLKKIQDYHKRNQNNIIKIKNKLQRGIAIKLEYIQGDSLENILKKQVFLPSNKSIKYASGIMNGLVEMRKAGVFYHRDIRPANILIDEKNDRAVIIDFGIATTDKRKSSKNNRRYGGVNDLVALGQVMHKMATGNHIFAESKSMERSVHAKKIKDYRDMVYSDKTGRLLGVHLKQIDKTIKDDKLRILIKACLTAKNYHYRKIQKMFKEFLEACC